MKRKEIKSTIFEYDSTDDLNTEDKELVDAAKEAALHSYAPYSQFSVGAAVRLQNGEIIKGSNQENAAYPSGLCAERVALFYANAEYPKEAVQAIAITAYTKGLYVDQPVPPCGSCRQVILETEIRFRNPIRIIMAGQGKIELVENAHSLLPLNFDDTFLRSDENK